MRHPKSWITALFILVSLCLALPAQANPIREVREFLDFCVPIPKQFAEDQCVRVVFLAQIGAGVTGGPLASAAVEGFYRLTDPKIDRKGFARTTVTILARAGVAYVAIPQIEKALEAKGIPTALAGSVFKIVNRGLTERIGR